MRFFGSAVVAIAALALMVSFAGGAGTAQAATWQMRGVATGAEENPPVPGGYSVYVTFNFDDVTNKLTYAATISGLSADQVTAAHIHRGAKGINGPIIYPLSTVGFTQISGTVQLTAADVVDLKAGNLYFNAHDLDNPGGFARMQLILPPQRPAVAGQGGRPGGPGPFARGPGGPGGPAPYARGAGRPGGQRPMGQRPGRPGPFVRPPSTGDAGLAATRSMLPVFGLLAFGVSGAGVFALARKHS